MQISYDNRKQNKNVLLLNPLPPHMLIMGHTAGNNWSCGSNSQISLDWTRAGESRYGDASVPTTCYVLSHALTVKKFVFTTILTRGSVLQCQACISGSAFMLSCTPKHLYHSIGYYIDLFWAQWVWLYYDKAGDFQYRNVLLSCNKTVHAN